MLKRIRALIKGKEHEEEQEIVSLDELSGLFDRWTAAIAQEREQRTAGDQQEIREAVTTLAHQVHALAPAEPDDEIHPKLAQVTKVSLPAFQKAMEGPLAHELPIDPALFYTEAGDLLKCAIRAQQGQGRYLRAVLPEEMDGIKESIAEIGRAINRMTAVFAEVNPRCDLLDKARGTHRRLLAAEKNRDTLNILAAEERNRAVELHRLSTETANELTLLEASAPYREYRVLVDRLHHEEENRDAARRHARVVAITAGHLFKRASKVPGQAKGRQDLFASAEVRLHEMQMQDPTVLSAATEAQSLIREGKLVLKNQEEKALFSGAAEKAFAETGGRLLETEAAVAATESTLAGSEAGRRYQELQRRVLQLEKQALAAEQSAADEEGRAGAAGVEASAARETLITQLTTVRGHPVMLDR